MISQMMSWAWSYTKIFWAVVCFVMIKMVHHFSRDEEATNHGFCDKNVFVDIAVAVCPWMMWRLFTHVACGMVPSPWSFVIF